MLVSPAPSDTPPPRRRISRTPSEESLALDSVSFTSKNTKGPRVDSVIDLIHDPICSGFLFKYCDAHYCAENITFVMEVDKFRDYFNTDRDVWHKIPWKQIDLNLKDKYDDDESTTILQQRVSDKILTGTLIDKSSPWPSEKVQIHVVEELVKRVWVNYISDTAPSQICMPSKVLRNTLRRLESIVDYGPDTFQEALIDPVKTIFRDIHPRFRVSPQMTELKNRLAALEELPSGTMLLLPPPKDTAHVKFPLELLQSEDFCIEFQLQDFLLDKTLYREFFKYLQVCILSENLRCVRAIHVFKEHLDSPEASHRAEATEWAWTIYIYFVAPHSAYEISASHNTRRAIQRLLATPHRAMFGEIDKTCMDTLRVHFNTFRTRKEYTQLRERLIELHQQIAQETGDKKKPLTGKNSPNGPPSVFGCFGV